MYVRSNKRYGWIRSLPDKRDIYFSAKKMALPASMDMRTSCPPVYNQGNLGSCTANAIGGLFEFVQMKLKLAAFTPSRLFIYFNERAMEGTINSDSGAEIRDGMKSVATQGVCPETLWPYLVSQFKVKPTIACYKNALQNRAIKYMRVLQDINQLKGCLAEGYPVVFGFTVYQSFESPSVAKTGIVPMPGANEKVLGGHAVVIVGYDDATSMFIVRNSWGTAWGQKGYFMMPYKYVLDNQMCDDFWTIRSVS